MNSKTRLRAKKFNTRQLDGLNDEIINSGLLDFQSNRPSRGYFEEKSNKIVSTRFEVIIRGKEKIIRRYSSEEIAASKWHEAGHKIWADMIRRNTDLRNDFYDLTRDALKTPTFENIRKTFEKEGKMTDFEEFFCDRFREYYRDLPEIQEIDNDLGGVTIRRTGQTLERFFDKIMEK